MGFGLLLIGYFCVNMVALYRPLAFVMLIGYGLMIFALYRLAPYHRLMHQCFRFSFLAVPFALYYAAYGLVTVGLLPDAAVFASFGNAVDWAYFAFSFLFQTFLLYAVFRLASELEITTLQTTALRNLIFLAVYHLLYVVASLPLSFIQSNEALLVLPITILRLLYVFCNLFLFYGCYRVILPEGSDVTPKLPDLMKGPRHKEK